MVSSRGQSSWWVLTSWRNKIDINFQCIALSHLSYLFRCCVCLLNSNISFSLPSMNYDLWTWVGGGNYNFAPTHHLQPSRGWFMREGAVDGTRAEHYLRSFWGLARGQILLTYFGLRICGWSLETWIRPNMLLALASAKVCSLLPMWPCYFSRATFVNFPQYVNINTVMPYVSNCKFSINSLKISFKL